MESCTISPSQIHDIHTSRNEDHPSTFYLNNEIYQYDFNLINKNTLAQLKELLS